MGKVNLTGNIHGKLGVFVTYARNGENYVKLYAKPKDRRTPRQLNVRDAFRKVAHIASALSRDVLRPYALPKPEKCSAYSRMIGINKLMFANNEWNPADLKIFEGPLNNPGITSAVLQNGAVTVSFDTAGGKDGDTAIAIAYNEATGGIFKAIGKRSAGSIAVPLHQTAGWNAGDLHAYLVFSRVPSGKSAGKGFVSSTAYMKVE